MRSSTAQKTRIKRKTSVFKQKRPNFVSLRGRPAAVAILKSEVWHPVAKHGAPARRISNISETKMVGFVAKPTNFVSLRGAQRRGNLKAEGMASRTEAWCPCKTDFKHFGNKNGRFSCKTYHFLCHCEAASRPQEIALRNDIQPPAE